MPKIMVALATYNGERYLGDMLDSLARQTRKPDKIFAVDDASTDTTVQILEAFDKLPIAVTRQERNCGVTVNFSTAIKAALAECGDADFIALADQDDIWLPEKLEILEREIGGADLVFGDAEVIDANGNVTADSWRKLARLDDSLSIRERILSRCNVSGCMSLCRVHLLKKALPLPPRDFVHDEWISFVATLENGVKSLKTKVIRYRIHGENSIGLRQKRTMSETLRLDKRKAEILLSAPKLEFTAKDRKFLERWHKHLQKIERGFLNFGELPWAFKNRRILFKGLSAIKTAEAVLFSCVGLRFAKAFFKKS